MNPVQTEDKNVLTVEDVCKCRGVVSQETDWGGLQGDRTRRTVRKYKKSAKQRDVERRTAM